MQITMQCDLPQQSFCISSSEDLLPPEKLHFLPTFHLPSGTASCLSSKTLKSKPAWTPRETKGVFWPSTGSSSVEVKFCSSINIHTSYLGNHPFKSTCKNNSKIFFSWVLSACCSYIYIYIYKYCKIDTKIAKYLAVLFWYLHVL